MMCAFGSACPVFVVVGWPAVLHCSKDGIWVTASRVGLVTDCHPFDYAQGRLRRTPRNDGGARR
jgi:hypothetical protein